MRISAASFKSDLVESGFRIIEAIYEEHELSKILATVEKLSLDQQFGVRAFLKRYPELVPLLFNQKLLSLIHQITPKAKVIKTIYFDKPPHADWIVNWHQDLTINVVGKEV